MFVTYHSLLVFHKDRAFKLNAYDDYNKVLIELTSKTLDRSIYYKRPNCLWTRCQQNHPHFEDTPFNPNDIIQERSFSGVQNATKR